MLPAKSILNLNDCYNIDAGDVVAWIPQEGSNTRDVTVGLPQVSDLFEARKKEAAILAEISRTMSFDKETKGKV